MNYSGATKSVAHIYQGCFNFPRPVLLVVIICETLALIVYFLDHSLIINLKQMNPEHNRVQLVSALGGHPTHVP